MRRTDKEGLARMKNRLRSDRYHRKKIKEAQERAYERNREIRRYNHKHSR